MEDSEIGSIVYNTDTKATRVHGEQGGWQPLGENSNELLEYIEYDPEIK